MGVKDLDWGNLGFGYIQTDFRYVSNFKNGAWDNGEIISDANVTLNESAGIFHYCQEVFEGLKANRTRDGRIVVFRPNMNAKRMVESAKRLEMPPFPEERFIDAIKQVVAANKDYVPPFGSGATLYIRPYMIGSSPVIGVKPTEEYHFRVFVTPVGPYFKGGVRPLSLTVPDFDRAAPKGTGNTKAGLNYAMSLHALKEAHRNGFDENMYLDSATRTYVEETGGANFIFVTKEGELITPESETILPSITRKSLLYVAEQMLGMKVCQRPIKFFEISKFAEAGLCGTAAVISPVGRVVNHGEEIVFPSGMGEMGPVCKKLRDTLVGIQVGEIEAPKGWLLEIDC